MNGSKQLWNIAKAKGKGLWGYLKKTIFNLSMCQNNSNTQTKLFCYCIIVDNNLKFHANQLWLPINISRYTYWKREENIVYNDEKCLATTKSPLKLIPNWLEWKMKKKKKKEDICKNFAQNHSLQIIFFQPTHCLSVKTEEVRVLKICP